MNVILQSDRALFHLINGQWHHPFLDALMPFIRNAQVWYPLYLFMILLVLFHATHHRGWWVLFFLLTPSVGDLLSSMVIKENVWRLRPCNNPELADQVRFLLHYRPQNSSFTSSHATNHFAIAIFYLVTLGPMLGRIVWAFPVWAAIIAYAQVYVGVHYPLDVAAGALLGVLVGLTLGLLFHRKFSLTAWNS